MDLLTWQAPEYEHRPKNVSWYWTSIIIAVLMLGFAVWQRNFLFAVFILLAEILILTWGGRHPEMTKFKFDTKGLTIGEAKFYPFSNMKSFSMESVEESLDEWSDFIIYFEKRLRPSLRIKAPRSHALMIRDILLARAPQIAWDPPFIEDLEKFLRF